jgi:hypothetical protein
MTCTSSFRKCMFRWARRYARVGKIPNVCSVRIRPRTKKASAEEIFSFDGVGKREGDCRFSCACASGQPIDLVLVIVMDPVIDLVENVQACTRRTSRKIDVITLSGFCTRNSFQDFCIIERFQYHADSRNPR